MAIKIAGNRVLDYDVLSYSNTNIAVGYQTLQSLTTGTNNSAVGNSALYDLTTATNNTVIGYNTGRGITTGSKNTIIGANVTGLSATLANTIILADGDGNKRIYVDSSGNVGIGTASPGSKLTVSGDIGTSGNIFLLDQSTAEQYIKVGYNRSGNGYSYIDLVGDTTYSPGTRLIRGNTGANAISSLEHRGTGDLRITTYEAAPICFYTSSSEKVRIDSSGNVGIGMTPSYRLHAMSSGTSTSHDSNLVAVFNTNGSGYNTSIRLSDGVANSTTWSMVGGTARLSINGVASFYYNDAGNVGIGAVSTAARLHISGGGGWSSSNFGKQLYITTPTNSSNPSIGISDATGGNNWAITNSSGSLFFSQMPAITDGSTGPSTRMAIDSSGNVSINTTTSGSKLQVVGTTSLGSGSLNSFGSGYNVTLTGANAKATASGSTVLALMTNDALASNPLTLELDLFGNSTATSRYAVISCSEYGTGNYRSLALQPYGGNVGIGTSSPSEALGVNGTVGIGNQATTGTTGALRIVCTGGASYIQSGQNKTTSSAAPLIFTSMLAGNEWMRIDSSGNVLIGTTSVSGILTVSGSGTSTIFSALHTGSNGSFKLNGTGATTAEIVADIGIFKVTGFGNTTIYADTYGNKVGIGTASPQGKLDVSGISDAGSVYFRSTGRPFLDIKGGVNSYKSLRFSDGNDGTYRWDFNAFPGDHATNPHGFGIWSSAVGQIMSITSGGNFGIGTAIPAEQLDLGGYAHLRAVTGNSYGYLSHQYISANSYDYWTLSSNFKRTGAAAGTINNSLLGTAAIDLMTAGGNVGTIAFSTGVNNTVPSEKMRIDSSGNIMVNTTTASGKLTVNQVHDGGSPSLYLNQVNATWGTTTLFANYRYIQTNSGATDGNFRAFHVGAGGVAIGYSTTPIYNSSDALYVNGNVGIFKSSPKAKLDVSNYVIHQYTYTSKTFTGGSWYRFITFDGVNTGDEVRIILRNGGGHDSVEITFSKHTTGNSNLGYVAEVKRKGTYAYTHNITKIRVCDNGVNAATSLEVQFGANHTNTMEMSMEGYCSQTFTINDMTAGAAGSSTTKELFVSDGVFGTNNQTVHGYSLASGDLFYILGNGNVGIGISSPTATLHVNASATTASSLTWGATAGQILRNEASELAIGLLNASPYPLWIQGRTNSNTARDIVLQPSGGNVGIGTTSPGKKLDIISGSEVGLRIAASTTSGYAYIQLGQSATAANNWHIGTEGDGLFRFYNGNWGSGALRAYLDNINGGTLFVNSVGIGRGGGGILENLAIGFNALVSNTTNGANTALGPYALQYNTGYDNTAVGYLALRNNTTGLFNTALGAYALENNSTASENTAIGSQTLRANTTGYRNTAVGFLALRNNTTGVENTAVGWYSMVNNTVGYMNVAVGRYAMQGNTTGYANVAVGFNAMLYNTTGVVNTAMGESALANNTTANHNVAIGYLASLNNTTGYDNTSLGSQALINNTTGFGNTAVGRLALLSNTTGYNNSAVGYIALYDATTGIQNTAIGYNTGRGITTGSKNTIIGANVTGLSATLANNIIIADGDGTKRLQIDSTGEAVFTRTGGGGLTIVSTYPTIAFQDTDNRSAFIHVNSNIFYVLRGNGTNVGQGNWAQVNSAWPLEINLETNNATFGGVVTAGGANGRFTTGFDSGQINSMNCSNWFRSNSTTGWYNETYGGGIYMTDSTYVRVYNSKSLQVDASGYFTVSLGVGTTPSGTTGEIRATNNITAYYSDQRLKENIRLITNPLEKVSKISGVTFTQNSLAETFGYNDYSQQVGVIAQEIQAVLPEAVTQAPFDIAEDGTSKSGENYLTVRYEKLVPLLIEAIKELSAKVKELENK